MSDASQFISKRAQSRKSSHFANVPSDKPPAGFKPHPKPLLLSYGTPNDGFFPIDSIEVNLVEFPFEHQSKQSHLNGHSKEANGQAKEANGQAKEANGQVKEEKSNSFRISRHSDTPELLDLSRGLQYGPVSGLDPLLQFTKEFISKTHKPAYDEWNSIVTTGASDGLNKACDAILDQGDVVLVEEFTFTPFLRFVNNAGGIPVPLKIDLSQDSNGLDYNYLENLLTNWSKEKPNLPKPKALYTISTGQNPTGFTQTLEFRRKVYKLAEEHNFVIIEDDPYGYLTLPKYDSSRFSSNDQVDPADLKNDITIEDYLTNHLTPSYLEIDTTGRVIRVETFSKLFAPGLRLGFVIAHAKIIDAIRNYSEVVNRGASGLSQTVVNNVIRDKLGGLDGWLNWILKMRATYSHRKDLLLHSIYKSEAFKKGLVDVIDPKAGMFATFKVKFLDPAEGNVSSDEVVAVGKQLLWKIISHGVLVVPGYNMSVDPDFSLERSNFFRLCYAPLNNDEDIIESGKRLTDAVLEFYNNGNKF
ncbi:ARO9 [Candida theae]|uniref:ARO9 n=1 Tax=Candida theae TaxID=1198502 RepID=A0AAD5BF16_9ASCO|nr:ARO9 [Candida theae]KAI5958578.1 ARO9 [Candida theae]